MEFQNEKCLCNIAVLIMAFLACLDYWDGSLGINVIGYATSIWVCTGSWHIFDDLSKDKDANVLDMYLWPKRYFKSGDK